MSLTLGQKLRQAREERGISIGEVSEQTRISPHYIESIENDDYKTLPGGIFNKGFVKSYARYVGYDEQEALSDYSKLISAQNEGTSPDEPRTYRPEVLTDDNVSSSRWPSLLFAVVILALMTVGILYFVNYLKGSSEQTQQANATTNTSSANTASVSATPTPPPASAAPAMGSVKIEFDPSDDIYLTTVVDGKRSETLIKRDSPVIFEPKDSLILGYHRTRASAARLTINGKPIELPQEPVNPKTSRIEFAVNGQTLPGIWESGKVTSAQPTVETPTPGRTATPRPKPSVASTIAPKPAATPAASASPKPKP
jgi:cytoskeletal protein RodZ